MKLYSKPLMLAAGLLMAGVLASCVTNEEKVQAQQKLECLEAGGRWGRGGLMGLSHCFPNYSDGGKACNSASDCQGMCMADTRTCAATFSFGCLSYLNDAGVAEEICID